MLKQDDQERPITIDSVPAFGGSMPATSLTLINAQQEVIWRQPKLDEANRVERPSTWGAFRHVFPGPQTSGMYAMLVGSNDVGIFQGVAGGAPECQVLYNNKLKNSSEPVRYRCKLSNGWLVPLADTPIVLKFQSLSDRDASHISIKPHQGPGGERWLAAGESTEVPLHNYPAPWYIDIYGDTSSVTEVTVHAEVDVPLLYGYSLEHVQTIRDKVFPKP